MSVRWAGERVGGVARRPARALQSLQRPRGRLRRAHASPVADGLGAPLRAGAAPGRLGGGHPGILEAVAGRPGPRSDVRGADVRRLPAQLPPDRGAADAGRPELSTSGSATTGAVSREPLRPQPARAASVDELAQAEARLRP